jgi:L-arabinose isomerase
VAEGESIAITPRPVSAPQMLFKPKQLRIADWCDAWLKAGSPHHMALAYGHLADRLHTLAMLGNWDFIGVETLADNFAVDNLYRGYLKSRATPPRTR